MFRDITKDYEGLDGFKAKVIYEEADSIGDILNRLYRDVIHIEDFSGRRGAKDKSSDISSCVLLLEKELWLIPLERTNAKEKRESNI